MNIDFLTSKIAYIRHSGNLHQIVFEELNGPSASIYLSTEQLEKLQGYINNSLSETITTEGEENE